jgi:hypothetical protein
MSVSDTLVNFPKNIGHLAFLYAVNIHSRLFKKLHNFSFVLSDQPLSFKGQALIENIIVNFYFFNL